MEKKKALITGATGFVGANLARLLLEEGRNLRILSRSNSDQRNIPLGDQVEVFVGDLRNAHSMHQAVRDCSEIYHVAADYRFWTPNPREIYESNALGTRNLAEAALNVGVEKFVHTSTVGTIGLSHQPTPANEKTPLESGQLTSHYKRSKLQAENIVLEYVRKGLPAVVVNPSTPVGSWDRKPTPTGKIIVDFVNGRLPAYVETGLNFVHVRDVCRGHLLAAEKGKIGERYILGNRNMSMFEFLTLLSNRTGLPLPRVRIPYPFAWLIGWASTKYADMVSKREPRAPLEAVKMSKRYMYFDSTKAIRELGLSQSPIESAVDDALDWFANNGYFTRTFTPQRGEQWAYQ